MTSKESFKKLVENVESLSRKTREELSKGMGYGKTYISEVLGPNRELSEKFVTAFKNFYKAYLENPNQALETIGGINLGQNLLSKNIKLIREVWEETEVEFAECYKVSVDTIKNYEKGKEKPIPRVLSKIAKDAGVTEYDLLNKVLTEGDIKKSQKSENLMDMYRERKEAGADPLQIIANLTESNRMLAEANLILANKINSGVPSSASSSLTEKGKVSKNPVEEMQSGKPETSSSKSRRRKKDSVIDSGS